jgi:tetratricopeptide (TPR) repeat protein
MASAEYDVFLSHAWADGARPQEIKAALEGAGLRVWFDVEEIEDFAGITVIVTEGLAKSKALVAYYSKSYPLRRACQWELTAAFLAAQIEGDPRRRVLVINPEEKSDHIHPIELRDAKFCNLKSNDEALRDLVQSVVKHVALIDSPLADIHQLTAPNWYGMIPVGSTRFVGRMREMWEVHSMLHAADVTQVSYAVATGSIGRISGLGGVGKSLLAEEYGIHFGAAYPGGVFWLRSYGDDSKSTLEPVQREVLRTDQVRQIAERLGIETDGLTANRIEGALARKIGDEGKPCLWVVDDVPNGLDGEVLRSWFSPHPLARTLFTTRSGEYSSLAKGVDLSVLTPDESLQLLTSRRAAIGEDEEEQARKLATELGYHALALDVTASALLSSVAVKPFSDFRARLLVPDKDALALFATLADALPNGHDKNVPQTILRSIRGLESEGLDFLRLASVLTAAPIPASLVVAVIEEADKLCRSDAEERTSLAFKQVTSATLAEIAGENNGGRSVHTLVSRAMRFHERGVPGRTDALQAAAVLALRKAIGKAADAPKLHEQIEFHVAHARHLIAKPGTIPEAGLAGCVAKYDCERGIYPSAHALWLSEFQFELRALGPEHPQTLTSMVNLATTFFSMGDLASARVLEEGALGVRRRVLGPDHPDTLTLISNLGSTLRAQGHLADARRMQEEALALQSKKLGPDSPDTLTTINNLAETLRAQKNLAGALELQERALPPTVRLWGLEHPKTLMLMSNLAGTVADLGDLPQARELYQPLLPAAQRVMGSNHPFTLKVMSNLAAILYEQGDFGGSFKLFEEALEVRRRVLGPEHPDTSVSAWWLCSALRDRGRHEAARAILQRDLLWLLDRDPAKLGASQQRAREFVAQIARDYLPKE